MTEIAQTDDSGESAMETVSPSVSAGAQQDTPAPQPVEQPTVSDDELPTIDEAAANSNQKSLPTIDEASSAYTDKEHPTFQRAFLNLHNPLNSPQELTDAQRVWTQNSYIGDVFKQFGVGYIKNAQENLNLEPDTIKSIQDFGAWKDFAAGEDKINKSFMDGTVIPAVRSMYESMRHTFVTNPVLGAAQLGNLMQTTYMTAPFAGAESAAEQLGKETGTGGALPAALEYLSQTAEGLRAFSGEGMAAAHGIPEPVLSAKAHGVLDGEGIFSGAKDPTPDQAKAMSDAESQLPRVVTPAKEMLSNIHTVARGIDPETFASYDSLSARKEAMLDQYHGLREQRDTALEQTQSPYRAEIDAMQRELDKKTPPKKAAGYPKKIAELLDKEQDWHQQEGSTETLEMADVRQKMQDINYQLQDIAKTGKVAEAYSRAAEKMSAENVFGRKPVQDAPQVEEPATKSEPLATNDATGIEGESKDKLNDDTKTVDDQHAAISTDVAKQLTAVGRSSEEANAVGELIASHYKTVAEMGWAKGTPEEIYQKHAAEIKTGKVRAKVLAQNAEGKTFLQKAKGKIRLGVESAKNVISLFKTADASTFVHELGHHWLDEMMKFSEDAGAPQSIKDHAETVNKWLGVKDGEEISTRQHEKFARGFERYMMEGVAPSQKLSRVFANFKKWLSNIYQTVNKLNSPITDDIRNVFDRLIVSDPVKTTIAPDRAPGEMLADIHEKEAAETPPSEAAKVRDSIGKEIDSTIQQHKPEIIDAVKSAEAGNVAETPSGAATDTGESQSQPTGSGAAQEPGTVTSSSGAAGAESGATRSGELGRSDAGGAGSTESDKQPSAHEPITDPESEYVDKAGNIRQDNLNVPEDVKNTLRDLAAQNDDFQSARGGVISLSQRSAMADSLGLNMRDFEPKKPEGVSTSVWADAVQKLTFQATQTVTRIGKEFADNGSEENWTKYLQAKQRLLMVADHFSSITAEAGRTLQVFDKSKMSFTEDVVSLLQHESGKDLFQMQREAKFLSKLDTTAKQARFIQASRKPSFGDMILEYWINGLISGPATHATYAVGNTLLSLWRAVPETAVASGIAKLHDLAGHESSGITVGEVSAKLKAGVESIPSALSAAGSALKSGVTTLLPGEEPWTLPFQTATSNPVRGVMTANKNITWHELGSQVYGAMQGMRDAFVSTGALIKNGGEEGSKLIGLKSSGLGAIPDITIKGVNALPIGTVARIPGRSVAGIHSFFRTVGYSMENAAIAYRGAVKENLTGTEFAARVAESRMNPSDAAMKESRGLATEATLMARGGEFTQALSKITNLSVNLGTVNIAGHEIGMGETKLLKFVDPFVHISSNILDQTLVQRTALGLLSKDMRDDLMGKNGAVTRDMAQARMLVGTALAATAGGLAAEGLMSGSGPSNNHERGIWIAAGNQPHSIKINDIWYDIHRLGPLGMLMSIGADMHDVAHAMGKEDASVVATMLAHAISQNVLDESFMRGPAEIIQAVTDSERYGPQYIRNFASSMIPYSVGMSQITRATDPYTRQTRTVMDAIKAKIPWESQSLMPRRDVWGEPIPNRDVAGVKGLSSIYETRINHDPVNQAFLKLGYYPSQPGRTIRGVKLSEPQYDDYARVAGRLAKQRLNNIVSQPGFSQVPPGKQVEVMRKIIETSREGARQATMMKYPEIMQTAVSNKRKILLGEK